MSNETILKVEGIGKSFGGLHILKDISFEVKIGERIGIIGPNGAGKTTFFNLLTGDLSTGKGSIYYCGRDITNHPNYKRAQIGIARTFQKNNLMHEMTVLEHLVLVLQRKHGLGKVWFKPQQEKQYPHLYEEASDLLNKWGLSKQANMMVKNLSYGEQRQVEILLGIATEPKVLLLDEPTAGLSQAETDYIVGLFYKLPKDITVLIIEHDLDLVFGLADRMIVFYNGKVLIDDTPENVKTDRRVNEIYIGKVKERNA